DIDANGIVQVSAKDKATNKEQQIRIQASGGLSDADIEQMVKDAEANRESDTKRKALVEAKNQAESLIHATEKSIAELGEKAPEAEKAATQTAISELREALNGDDVDAIKSKTDALGAASMKIGEHVYRAQQEAEQQGAASGDNSEANNAPKNDGAKDGDVIDAEFTDVDDGKRGAA
ncbi:MAG: dnaK, partial [Alphaproteobacteria bacterium]|nr:dnaK [Alphaproteobacteria bacterium]